MMTYETFHSLAVQQDRVCLSKEINGDMETPISLYQKLRTSGGSFLLESVTDGVQRGRFSYMGSRPAQILTSRNNTWTLTQTNPGAEDSIIRGTGRVLDKLRHMLEASPSDAVAEEGLPDFTGGAVGTLSYDLVRQYETLPDTTRDDLRLPEACLMLVEELAAYDHARQTIVLMVSVDTTKCRHTSETFPSVTADENQRRLYEAGMKKLKAMEAAVNHPTRYEHTGQISREKGRNPGLASTETPESFCGKVAAAKEYIRNGDIFQVVISQRFQVHPAPDPFDTYRALRNLNPSPYLFFLDFDTFQLAGASPEMLVKVNRGKVETCPIAGTRPRGKDAAEDEVYAREMLADEKERAEHLMLVDLARNDVGRVSRFGTVTVNPYMEVKKFSHVMHLVSEVQGELAEGSTPFEALTACLPAGTLSGAPKIRAMEIIDQLETKRRGPYGGAVGYFSYNGSMDTCITIRSVVFTGGSAYVQAGAGIVEDSVPEAEYEESVRKASGLLEVLQAPVKEAVS